MQAGTAAGTNGSGKRVRARKEKDGQEQVLKPTELKSKLDYLVRLKKTSDDAKDDLNDAIKAVAEKSGYLASVVRKIVTAKAGEDFDGKKREAEQLELAFQAAE